MNFSKERFYENCFIDYSKIYKKDENIYKIISRLPQNIYVFDPIPIVCSNLQCEMFDESNRPLYGDSNHFSDYANKKYLFPKLNNFLKKNKLI